MDSVFDISLNPVIYCSKSSNDNIIEDELANVGNYFPENTESFEE